MTIVVVEVIPLIFQRIARLICSLPPRSATSHQLVDVVLVHSKVCHPAHILDLVLTDLPVLDAVDSDIGTRCVERQVIDTPKALCNPCGAVVPLLMTHPSGVLSRLPLLEQRAMIALLDAEDRVAAGIMQGFDVRGMGTESIFGDDEPQMRGILAQRGHEALGRMALTILFLAAIVFAKRFGHQRNHCAPVRMNECGPQQWMRRGDRTVAVVLFEIRLTMHGFGGNIPGAIEGKHITAREKYHLFKRFAALQLPKDACEQRPQGFGCNGIEHLSHVRVARGARNAVDGCHVACGALLVKVEKGWACERKQGKSRHEGVRQRDIGLVTAVIRDVGEQAPNEAEKCIRGKMFAFFGCNEAHVDPQDNDIKA